MNHRIITDDDYNKLLNENRILLEKNNRLLEERKKLNDYLEITFEYVSLLFDFPKDRLKQLIKNYERKIKE